MTIYCPLPLEEHYNNNGFSYLDTNQIGNFTTFGSSYPGDELPDQENVQWRDVPFHFPLRRQAFNNIELDRQRIPVPLDLYSTLYILGAADNGSYHEFIDFERAGERMGRASLDLTNWTETSPHYNEEIMFQCSGMCTQKGILLTSKQPIIWFQQITLEEPISFDKILLPDNPCMHIFALTLGKEWNI
ncbi:hypothetical protein MKY92_26365 [Paenibacillus sp. FSL R5-0623]|uniref:hypothetical protein n=1 Tax=unclassified Paenibacillus TaxID=185978 RepID=UPI0030DCB0CF